MTQEAPAISDQPYSGKLANYGGKSWERRKILKSLCPCRNSQVRDVETWRSIIRIATNGSLKERNSAAHAIGTMLGKAKKNEEWQQIALQVEDDLHVLMDDTRASRSLLGTLKKHGHASRGTARRNYRRIVKSLDFHSPGQLANWINERQKLAGKKRLDASHSGIKQLTTWIDRRKRFEPDKRLTESAILAQAQRILPTHFK